MFGVVSFFQVLGDYVVKVDGGSSGTRWTLTARTGGKVAFIKEGVASNHKTETFTVTITEYVDSDCKNDSFGEACINASTTAIL